VNEVGIVGDGAWGITLSILLHENGVPLTLFGYFPERVSDLRRTRRDEERLPGTTIPEEIRITDDPLELRDKDPVLYVVPSKFLRNTIERFKAKPGAHVISAVKGIEVGTCLRMSQVLEEELKDVGIAVLSGPSIAREVIHGLPTTVVVASRDEVLAQRAQDLLHSRNFRVYRSNDVIGVELGGALKNIIALASGACDGLGLGANTKGALLTRGIAEMMKLGVALGAEPITFSGLSGVGDLITTCMSPHSRNRHVGEQLGRGRSIQEILADMVMVAEGISTTEAALTLSRRMGIDMPITEAVFHILQGELSPQEAIVRLMKREPKPEYDFKSEGS
jgi:glycerol-3-phosphate dehydrogenase (NAD(P)+)